MGNSGFKLAMGQMLVEGGEVERNLNRAAHMVQDAARQGCAVVVLPECLDVGWTDPSARQLAQPIPGPTSEKLNRLARQFRLYLAAGLTERARNRLYFGGTFSRNLTISEANGKI
jgi:predicted amidohydrolase